MARDMPAPLRAALFSDLWHRSGRAFGNHPQILKCKFPSRPQILECQNWKGLEATWPGPSTDPQGPRGLETGSQVSPPTLCCCPLVTQGWRRCGLSRDREGAVPSRPKDFPLRFRVSSLQRLPTS